MSDINTIESGAFAYGSSFCQMPPGVANIANGTLTSRTVFYDTLPQPRVAHNYGVMPVDSSTTGVLLDGSGTIAQANVSQVIFPERLQRNYLLFINNSNTLIYVNINNDASTSNSYPVSPNGQLSFEGGFIPDGRVTAICAASGKSFIAKEG